MKILIALLISFQAQASFIALSDLVTCEKANLFSHEKICESDKGGDCVPFPGGYCQQYDVVDEIVNGKPIYAPKENVVDCESIEACELLRENHCSSLIDYQFFYAENLILPGYEAYCTKVTGYEQVNTGKKVLKVNAQKLSAHKAKLDADKAKRDQDKIKEAKIQAKLRQMAEAELAKEAP